MSRQKMIALCSIVVLLSQLLFNGLDYLFLKGLMISKANTSTEQVKSVWIACPLMQLQVPGQRWSFGCIETEVIKKYLLAGAPGTIYS